MPLRVPTRRARRYRGYPIALLSAACTPATPPPPRVTIAGLPVSGDRAFAAANGFTSCLNTDAVHLRCRRHGVSFLGQGPFEAALDLRGGAGESGFDQITLWHDDDQEALYALVVALARGGWRYCYTGTEQAGDQAIFTRAGDPVRLSMDISYYGKRRLRILPDWNHRGLGARCTPDDSLVRFGADVAKAAAR